MAKHTMVFALYINDAGQVAINADKFIIESDPEDKVAFEFDLTNAAQVGNLDDDVFQAALVNAQTAAADRTGWPLPATIRKAKK